MTSVPDPVVLGADPMRTAAFVAFLRDHAARLTGVTWRGSVTGALDPAQLHHLPPPDDLGPEHNAAVARWRAGHRHGMFYYRRGPGFVLVRDVRRASAAARYTIDDPVLIRVLLACQSPVRLSSFTSSDATALALLIEERLVLRVDDVVVGLPARALRWPIPCTAV